MTRGVVSTPLVSILSMSLKEPIKGTSNLAIAMHSEEAHEARKSAHRFPQNMRNKLFETSRKTGEQQLERNEMKRVLVSSNFARSRTIVLGNGQLVLHFDRSGEATMPDHLLPLLKAEMRARPGRYKILSESLVAREEDAQEAVAGELLNLLEKLKEQDKEERVTEVVEEGVETSEMPQEPEPTQPEPEVQPERSKAVHGKKKKMAKPSKKVTKLTENN